MQKQVVNINFAEGINTKDDPWQLPVGQFLSMENSIFTIAGQMKKRNGFGNLTNLPSNNSTYLTTFNGNLTAIGSELEAYAQGPGTWFNKGTIVPVSLSVLPTSRSALNQTQCDSVIAVNNLMCTVFTEVNTDGTSSYKYIISDADTGQNIILPTVIPIASGAITGSARVFALGGYFIIAFTNLISAVSHLQYVAISISNPASVTTNTDIAPAYIPAATLSWDGVVVGNNLFFAYNMTAVSQRIRLAYLSSSLVLSGSVDYTSEICTMMSLCVDNTIPSNPIIYAAYYDSAGSTGSVLAIDTGLNKRMSATQIIPSGTVYNITCTAQNGVQTIAYELSNQYSYDSSLPTNLIKSVSVTLPATVTTGAVGSVATPVRGAGLASKACLVNSTMYVLLEYASSLQPTYFLVDILGNIVAKFAYENGGASLDHTIGYLPLGLPQAQVIGSVVSISYLYKDLVQTQNTLGLIQSVGLAGLTNIYSQTGVNLAKLDFTSDTLAIAEIGGALNLSGGYLWDYDGQTLAEQNFHLFPSNVEATLVADPGPTGTTVSGSPILTTLSSVANITVGMVVTDVTNPTAIAANTTVIAVGTTTITMSANAVSSHSGDTLKFVGAVAAQQYYYQAIYQWTNAAGNIVRSAPSVPITATATSSHTSIKVNVPTIRLTNKTNVKINIYRWSVAQQIYYQVTPISSPLLNSKSVDSVTFQDIYSDAQIVGNSIIYTDGGVVENIGTSALTAIDLFDDRLWGIDAEDPNLLLYSKQIIEATPVEMSDLFSIYVAPSTGAQGSTGTMKCLFPMDDKQIIFKKNAIYYFNGSGPDNTGAGSTYSQPIFITSAVGCANQKSIVLIPQGLMFQSDKGIWLLGRNLETQYIGAKVEAFNGYTVNSASVIPETTQVRFTLSNGKILLFDYFYNQWDTNGGAPAVSSTIYQDLHTIINSSGIVAQETPGIYLDNGNPVLLSFVTGWINLAGLQGYQRLYEILLLASYQGPHQIEVQIAYDYAGPSQREIITPNNITGVYGSDALLGQTSPLGGTGPLEQWRIQTEIQKCEVFQIILKEIYNSSFGKASAGFTLSQISCVVGVKKGYKPFAAKQTAG